MEAPAFPAPDKHRAGAFYFFDPRVAEKTIHSTLVPGAASSNTVCTGGLQDKPNSFQRATTCS
jgi:hypothetical protein